MKKTAEEIAQLVIDNRYPKSENQKVSDSEMYHVLVEQIKEFANHKNTQKKALIDMMTADEKDGIYDKPTQSVEDRALELYPDLFGTKDEENGGTFEWDANQFERNAYIKGATDNQDGETFTRKQVVSMIQNTAIEFGIMHPPKDDGKDLDRIDDWTKKTLSK